MTPPDMYLLECHRCHEFKVTIKSSSIAKTVDTCAKCRFECKILNESIPLKNPAALKNRNFKCIKCNATETSQIRPGPDGERNNCNRCGIAWTRALSKAQSTRERMDIRNVLN